MKNILSILSLFIVLSLLSCQKALDEEEMIYQGNWSSRTYALQIYGNGYGLCQSKKWGIGLVCEGYVRIRSRHIVFTGTDESSTLPRKKFTIDQKPAIDSSGVTYMVLDGERFEKL